MKSLKARNFFIASVAIVPLTLLGKQSLANTAVGGSFTYNVLQTSGNGNECLLFAKDLAAKFNAVEPANSIRVTEWNCEENPDRETWRAWVTYEADQELPVVETLSLGRLYHEGGYASKSVCEGALPNESKVFKEQTGLDPLYAFCRESLMVGRLKWDICVAGIGELAAGKKAPIEESVLVFGGLIEPWKSQLVSKWTSFVSAHEALVTYAFHRTESFLIDSIKMRYYSNSTFNFHFIEMGRVATRNCPVDAARINQALEGASATAVMGVCIETGAEGENSLEILAPRGQNFRAALAPPIFQSVGPCAAQLPEVLNNLRTLTGKDIFAGVCGLDSLNQYRITYLSKQE